jgi:hypothetical protein
MFACKLAKIDEGKEKIKAGHERIIQNVRGEA